MWIQSNNMIQNYFYPYDLLFNKDIPVLLGSEM